MHNETNTPPLVRMDTDPEHGHEAEAMVTIVCRCGITFLWQDESFGDFRMPRPVLCDDCTAEGVRQATPQTRAIDPATRFRLLALDGYADSDPLHPGLHPECLRAALDWTPKSGKGLGLVGRPGLGKSRCAHLALYTAFAMGRSCFAISHLRFAQAVGKTIDGSAAEKREAQAYIDRAFHAGVLLIDEVGKAPHIEVRTSVFFDLLEHRTANSVTRKLLTLWTGQAGGQYITDRYGADYGPAIDRRLGIEFNTLPLLPRK